MSHACSPLDEALKPSTACYIATGPPGYASLGDVAVQGDDPPPRPARMYKDVPSARPDAPGEGPRLAPPAGFQLMYRSSAGSHPITVRKCLFSEEY